MDVLQSASIYVARLALKYKAQSFMINLTNVIINNNKFCLIAVKDK